MKRRSMIALLTSAPLALLVLGIAACLPVPVGDPETSKIDPAFEGAWVFAEEGEATREYYVVRPWDARTYMVRSLTLTANESPDGHSIWKAWLTPIAGATVVTLEPITHSKLTEGKAGEPLFAVGKIEMVDQTIKLRLINPKSELVKGVDTREKAEALVTQHIKSDELFGEPVVFKKADPAELAKVLEKFHVGNGVK